MSDPESTPTPKLSENPDIPVLEGWVGISETAERLGITRQHSYKRAKAGGYRSLHRIGNSSITVVSTTEIDDILKSREDRAKEQEKNLPI